jgi:hypothetical protein
MLKEILLKTIKISTSTRQQYCMYNISMRVDNLVEVLYWNYLLLIFFTGHVECDSRTTALGGTAPRVHFPESIG